MSLHSFIIGRMTRPAAREFEAATKDPKGTQERVLMEMVRRNEGCEYGRKYGFASIKTVADFQRQVPMITYEDIRDDMERLVNGERNIFTTEDPVMFAQTSGTTGNPKYIPATPTCQGSAHSNAMKVWTYHTTRKHPAVASRKIVSLVSPAIEGHTPSGVPFGSASGQIYRDMSPLIKRSYAIPYDVFEISDYQAKYYTLMRIGVASNVGLICTANPSSILKMCDKANEFSEEIIRDINDGTLWQALHVPPQIRRELEKRLKPNPRRAKMLAKARASRGGVLKPADYWPSIAMIGCWKGGTVGHYIEKFPEWFYPDGQKPLQIRDWGYLSSEARGSIPLSDEGSRGALTILTNFFEFVPVEQVESNPDDQSDWEFLTADQLADGGEYYVFFTTTGGLYRYDINDVIQVQGTYNNTPQIVFLRKGRGMTNLTGEKVSVNQVIESFQAAGQKAGAMAAHFKAEADLEKSRYVFRVEFVKPVDRTVHREFLKALDEHLKSVNIEYKGKRESMRLAAPVLHVMREGWYEAGRKQWADSGRRAFQAKTVVLTADHQQTIDVKPDLVDVVELMD